jgi:plastocyanin
MLFLKRRAFLHSAVAAAALAALGRPARAATAANPVTIEIEYFTFSPSEVTVPPGTRVTWVNHDDEPHSVVSLDMVFRSAALDTDDDFSFVFDRPGSYRYVCSIHPHMKGLVTVLSG